MERCSAPIHLNGCCSEVKHVGQNGTMLQALGVTVPLAAHCSLAIDCRASSSRPISLGGVMSIRGAECEGPGRSLFAYCACAVLAISPDLKGPVWCPFGRVATPKERLFLRFVDFLNVLDLRIWVLSFYDCTDIITLPLSGTPRCSKIAGLLGFLGFFRMLHISVLQI